MLNVFEDDKCHQTKTNNYNQTCSPTRDKAALYYSINFNKICVLLSTFTYTHLSSGPYSQTKHPENTLGELLTQPKLIEQGVAARKRLRATLRNHRNCRLSEEVWLIPLLMHSSKYCN